jgi:precorrin-2 dehydrogenase/sirohydrochlorin ferrochelatase
VLVFGGGPVGERKARAFGHEARVVVVAPEFESDDAADVVDSASAAAVERVRAAPTPADVHDWVGRVSPVLVVAATDDAAVNDAAEAAARGAGALVNRADESGGRGRGSVAVPATVRDGGVAAALTTGGASPALAAYLRDRLEAELDGAGVVAAATGDLRAKLKAGEAPPERRRDAVRAAVRDDGVWAAARDGDEATARERAAAVAERALSAET